MMKKDSIASLVILVVDDSAITCELLETMLTLEEAIVFTASNGKEACKIVEHECIDLVLTDIQMPQMDGVELARYLRSQGFNKPVIAISAAPENEQQDIIEQGIDDFIQKPIVFTTLVACIQHWLHKYSATPCKAAS